MSDRLDVLMTRSYQSNGETKTQYTKIGVAFSQQGGGFRLKLDAIPVPTIFDGKVELSMLLLPPRQDEAPQQRQQGFGGPSKAPAVAPAFDPNDSDIPF